ncbi:MAG: hypothetical protein HY583_00315 [Candidatus Omnitrophica bacterium]|nr:hypothetical protein [Candidatus Omnitrophota bacterium]
MTQSQYQNQKIKTNLKSSLKPHTLKNGQLELTFFPDYGCYWNTLRINLRGKWVDFLKALHGDQPPFRYGSYLMAPWSNRIVQGVFEFEGKRYQLQKNFPDQTAIHGDVRNRPWKVQTATDEKFEAVLESRTFSDFNYPFKLQFHHSLRISENCLRMSLSIENVDRERAPVGFGFHPFFKRRLTDQDQDVILLLPAQKVYPDEKCIPTSSAVSVSGKTDLRSERLLGSPNLDHCFTDLTSNLICLIYPGSKVEVQYRLDPIFTHVVVYAPSEDSGEAKDFVAVEPVTHVNNGFNFYTRGWNGTGVQILEPGDRLEGGCELSVKL